MPVPGRNSANSRPKTLIMRTFPHSLGKTSRVHAADFLWHATHFLDVGPVLARPVFATSS
jgi:hypothetical protein